MRKFFFFLRDESGATVIEYCVIAFIISIAAVAAIKLIGTTTAGSFNHVAGNLPSSKAR